MAPVRYLRLEAKLKALEPFRKRCIESKKLCINLCHKLDWASKADKPRIHRILERARARDERRYQALKEEEDRSLEEYAT